MANIGALNRRLDKVEATAAAIGGSKAQAFELYALCFLVQMGTEESINALREVRQNLPDMTQRIDLSGISNGSRKLIDQAFAEARAAIRAAGETEITPALLEVAFFHLQPGRRGKPGEWKEAYRDNKMRSVSEWIPCVAMRLWDRVRVGEELWGLLLSGNDDGPNA